MLCQLAIQDIVLIDRLTLEMGAGLTALTGETGAGKSILLDSLSLAVGAKADKGLVRHGAEKGMVAATFEVGADHPAWTHLDEGGLSTEDDTITLRRVQLADGRSRAFINDQACSIGLLRSVGETLLEIHGQHQSLGFLNVAAHRSLLDQYAGLVDEVARRHLLQQRPIGGEGFYEFERHPIRLANRSIGAGIEAFRCIAFSICCAADRWQGPDAEGVISRVGWVGVHFAASDKFKSGG